VNVRRLEPLLLLVAESRRGQLPPDGTALEGLRSSQMHTTTGVLVVAGALAGLVVFIAGCGSTTTVTETVTVTTVKAEQAPPARQTLFGHINSLQAKRGGFVMRFDPEWFLSGSTANAAAAEDGAVEPGQPVPNDNYRVDEGHRLFTYKVPADTHVTVITKAPTGMPITVSQLAHIVNGTSNLKLFEPLESGVWIVVHDDTVRSIDQQYQP